MRSKWRNYAVYLTACLLLVAGVTTISCSFITVSVTESYTSLEEVEVIKQESRPEFSRSFGIGFSIKHVTFDLLEGETVNCHYHTGTVTTTGPYTTVFFAIINETIYSKYETDITAYPLDWAMAHAEYCCAHGLPGQGDNWNWTVPYDNTWHFILDFRWTFRDDCYFCITRYYLGTEYREVINYRDIQKPILPSHCLYLGVGLLIVGTVSVAYIFKGLSDHTFEP